MRPADAHLTPQEFELLLFEVADSNNSNATGASVPEAQQHLSECAGCRSVAERYRNAEEALRTLESGNKASVNKNRGNEPLRGPDCPIGKMWLSLAAGLMEEDEASRYVTHAATCDWCGPLLKESMEDLAQDVTPEEQETLAKLPTASLVWQREMGSKLAAQNNDRLSSAITRAKKAGKSKKIGWWSRFAWAACSLAFVVIAGWFIGQRQKEPDPNDLLAQAYTLRRTFEPRIAGAAYGPLRVERGNTVRTFPAQFFEAEKLIHISRHAENTIFMQAQARAYLLQWNFEDAIRELDRALILKPNDSGLLLDKATALYERAQTNGGQDSRDYRAAADLLSHILAKYPEDPVALFNRAVIFEQLRWAKEGIADCEQYLRIDPGSPWAQEVRSRLERLKQRAHTHKFLDPPIPT